MHIQFARVGCSYLLEVTYCNNVWIRENKFNIGLLFMSPPFLLVKF